MVTGRKGRGEGKKGPGSSKRVTFVTWKVIGRMIASIDKSGCNTQLPEYVLRYVFLIFDRNF